VRGKTWVNFRSCGEDGRHVQHSANGARQEDESGGAFKGTREEGSMPVMPVMQKPTLSRSCCILNMPWHSATALAPLSTHKMTKTTS